MFLQRSHLVTMELKENFKKIHDPESCSADREFRLISRELKFKRGHPLPVSFFDGSHLTSASASIERFAPETRSHCRRDNCPVITERWRRLEKERWGNGFRQRLFYPPRRLQNFFVTNPLRREIWFFYCSLLCLQIVSLIILFCCFFFFNQNIYEKEFDSSVAFKSKCNLIAILVKCLFLSYYSCKEEINFSLFIMNLMGKLRIRRWSIVLVG